MKNIEERIIKIREAKGLSKSAIAEKLGFERQNYQYLEKRGVKLTYEQIENIATALDVSVQELLFGDSEVVQINKMMLKDELEKEYATKMEMLELKLEVEKSKKENSDAKCKLYERVIKDILNRFLVQILEDTVDMFINMVEYDFGQYTDKEYEEIIKDMNMEARANNSKYNLDWQRIYKRMENYMYHPDYYYNYKGLALQIFSQNLEIDFEYYFENKFVTNQNLIHLWYIHSHEWCGGGEPPVRPEDLPL